MAKNIPDDITTDDVLDAIKVYLDGSVAHGFHESEKYDLLHDGKRYPPKAILGIAARRSAGHVLVPSDFSGGEGSPCFRILRRCGFTISLKGGYSEPEKTYLYTWNPSKWEWIDLPDAIAATEKGEGYEMYWSCGITKSISKNERFLLMRLGVDPKGIVGGGDICSAPYELAHWNQEKKAKGQTALRTDVRFTALASRPLVTLDELERSYPDVSWTPQNGGVSVPEEIAAEILKIIEGDMTAPETDSKKLEQKVRRLRMAPLINRPEGVKSPKKVTRTTEQFERDTSVRAWVLEAAKGKCELCGSDAPFVDDAGLPFLEVHHIIPLADNGKDVVANAAALCPNCHRKCHYSSDRESATKHLTARVASVVSEAQR